MARVYNWQIGREMDYPYEPARPKKQFAMVMDLNKCIACQTCTVACKTTWTASRGQEYMFWNNVESKPYGYYPLGWDVKSLNALGVQEAGEKAVAWLREDSVKAVKKAKLGDKMTFISTGGGASLELLEGKILPGVACLKDK